MLEVALLRHPKEAVVTFALLAQLAVAGVVRAKIGEPSDNAQSVLHKQGQAYIVLLKAGGGGEEPPLTVAAQAKYCAAAAEWARRHAEASDGRHGLTRVDFFRVGEGDAPSNHHVQWYRMNGRPFVDLIPTPDKTGKPVAQITMYDVHYGCRAVWEVVDGSIEEVDLTCEHADPEAECTKDFADRDVCTIDGELIERSAFDWGWVLAHENSHWFYAIDDEYRSGGSLDGLKVCVGDPDTNVGTEQTSMMAEWHRNHWCDDVTHVDPLIFGGLPVGNPMNDSGWERARTHWPVLEVHVDGTYPEVDLDALDPLECVWHFELLNDAAILLDASGSMGAIDPQTQQTALSQAVEGALGFYNSTVVGRASGILRFKHDTEWTIDFAPFVGPFVGPLNLAPGGQTDICEAIIGGAVTVWAENPDEAHGAMVLLTDGRPTVGNCNTDADVLNAAAFACKGGPYPITIFPLAYGDSDAELLAEVAATCGGALLAAGQDSPFLQTPPHDMKVDLARAGYRVRHGLEILHVKRTFDALEQSETFHVPERTPRLEVAWLGNGKDGVTVGGIEIGCDLADLVFELESPAGELFDAELHSVVGPGELDYHSRTVRVDDPAPGRWTARIRTSDTDCLIVAPRFGWVGSVKHDSIRIFVEAIPDRAPRNAPVTIVAWLENPGPYKTTGLTARATVLSRGAAAEVELRDDGLGADPVARDGFYTGTFNADSEALPPGPYTVRAWLSASARASSGVPVPAGLPEIPESPPPPTPLDAELVVENCFVYRDCRDPELPPRGSTTGSNRPCRPGRLRARFGHVIVGRTHPRLTAVLRSTGPLRTEGLEVGMGPGVEVSDVRARTIGRRGALLLEFRATVRPDAPTGRHALTVRSGSIRIRREDAFVVRRRPGDRGR